MCSPSRSFVLQPWSSGTLSYPQEVDILIASMATTMSTLSQLPYALKQHAEYVQAIVGELHYSVTTALYLVPVKYTRE